MKIYLDLLPQEKKEEIKKRKIFLKVVKQEILFSIPIVSFILILVTINIALGIRLASLEESLSLGSSGKEYKELQSYEDKFSEINSKTSSISKMQKEHLNWLGVFYKINNVIPDNVYLSDLASNNYKISLIGKSKTREELIKFQENIRSEDCFSNINVPLSSLVSKENLEFQIDFEIKPDCLKNKNQ